MSESLSMASVRRLVRNNICFLLPILGTSVFLFITSSVQTGRSPQTIIMRPFSSKLFHSVIVSNINSSSPYKELEPMPIRKDISTLPRILDTSPHPNTRLKDMLEVQADRQQKLEQQCALHQRHPGSRSWPYKLNHKFKYLFCPIPKSGWSSWKRLWFYMSGAIKDFDEDPGVKTDTLAGVSDISLSAISKAQKDGRYNYSFVFVRNPWERLVSAYTNKAVDYNYTRVMHAPCAWERMKPYKEDLTFEQFITCIGQGRSRDMHWQPQSMLCDFCTVHYDFLGHLETADVDAPAVLKNLEFNMSYPHVFSSKKYDTHEILEEMYKSIPIAVLEATYRRFYYDFQLFGYDSRPPGRLDIDFSDIKLP